MIEIKRYIKYIKHSIFICTVILILLVSQGCAKMSPETTPHLVKIMVNVPGGAASVESENPIYIDSGGTAQFTVTINNGFKLENIETIDSAVNALTGNGANSSDGAYYEDGILYIENALYPSTIRLDVRPLTTYKYIIENNPQMGTVVSSAEQGRVVEDTFIAVSAEPADDCIFIGWSRGASLARGGQFLSYSAEYSFSLVSDMTVYANYLSKNSRYIKYNANGGVLTRLIGSEDNNQNNQNRQNNIGNGDNPDNSENIHTLYYEINTRHYPCPNAFGDTGVFSREGYALLEYNTQPDGSGVAIGLGANINIAELMPDGINGISSGNDGNILELFAQWVKYTDVSLFTYTESDAKITITGYNGNENEEMIVIPEEIDGKPVVAVANGSIKGSNVKTLFLTKNITSVSLKAIMNCQNLETLYISDSITKMQNESIANCPKLANFYVNAVIPPRYFENPGWGSSIKYKRLITAPGKRLTVISGSSSAFGLWSPLLTELLDNEYSVVNYGTHAGACALFFLEFTSNQTREGDIVVMAPEPIWDSQQGANWLDALTFQLIEGAYDAFRHVDIRNYINVFAAFADYNSTRSKMSNRGSYDDYMDDVNVYGDILTNQANHPEDYAAGGQWVAFGNVMTAAHAANLNRVNDTVLANGGRMYLSCSPVNRNALVDGGDREAKQTAYINNIIKLVDFPVISVPGDYIFPGNYFSDTDHHLNDIHSADRTIQLAKDLKAQFELE